MEQADIVCDKMQHNRTTNEVSLPHKFNLNLIKLLDQAYSLHEIQGTEEVVKHHQGAISYI